MFLVADACGQLVRMSADASCPTHRVSAISDGSIYEAIHVVAAHSAPRSNTIPWLRCPAVVALSTSRGR